MCFTGRCNGGPISPIPFVPYNQFPIRPQPIPIQPQPIPAPTQAPTTTSTAAPTTASTLPPLPDILT